MTSTLSQPLIPPALSETATAPCIPAIQSPNGGPTAARRDLDDSTILPHLIILNQQRNQ